MDFLLFRKVIAFILLTSCGELNYSPYVFDIRERKLNEINLSKIITRSTKFSNKYKVAVIADSHNYFKDLNKQVHYINRNYKDIAFVIHLGDVTNFGLLLEWEMFLAVMDKLRVPFLLVIGNHDMLLNGIEIYKKMFGNNLNFSFSFKQTKYILYNNNNWESDELAPDFYFLQNELELSKDTSNILFGHVQADDPDRYTKNQRDEMRYLVNAYEVDYILNGHNHNYGHGFLGNSIRLTAGSSSKKKLLLLSISDEGNSYDFVSP